MSNKLKKIRKMSVLKNFALLLKLFTIKLLIGGRMQEKIIALIAEKLNKKIDSISLNSRLVEDLGADSLDVVEMIMAFEDEFGVSLPDEEVEKMKTVKDVVDYIAKIKK